MSNGTLIRRLGMAFIYMVVFLVSTVYVANLPEPPAWYLVLAGLLGIAALGLLLFLGLYAVIKGDFPPC